MTMNLDTLKTEIPAYLKENGFVIFHGVAHGMDEMFEVRWDTARYPDYKEFLVAAKELGVKMVVFHHEEFASDMVEEAIDELPSSAYDYEDQRTLERRLRELSV